MKRAWVVVVGLASAACSAVLGLPDRVDDPGVDLDDGGTVTTEAAPSLDAEPPPDQIAPLVDAADAFVPPDPVKVTVSFAAGKDAKVYRFDAVAKIFTALVSTGCPVAEETAVMSDGSVYVTSSDNQSLFRWTATGCTSVRAGSNFPYALGTAPIGTLSATEEVLVGYMGAGDYVRVDRNNGDVVTVTPGALGQLRPAGDLTAFGARGYLAALQGTGAGAFACAAGGDCIVEVSLVTGRPVALLERFAGLGIYGLAHSRGSLLFYANGEVFPYDLTTKVLGPSLAPMPGGAGFSGAGAPPYP